MRGERLSLFIQTNDFKLFSYGDSAVLIELGETIHSDTHEKVRRLSEYLDRHPFAGMTEYIPSFTSVTAFFDPKKTSFNIISSFFRDLVLDLDHQPKELPVIVEIPVCYGGDFGPDLEYVARYNRLTTEEVVKIHSSGDYLVYMIGFSPGFPYLGGMSERISVPRKDTPRLSIPAGSVGIAGKQTGIYPISTPGGWQLIGRTPLELFLPEQDPPSLLNAGNVLRFVPISLEEFSAYKEKTDEH
jgi:inhibitor of KinA